MGSGIYNIEESTLHMVGRKLASVTLNKERNTIAFAFEDGKVQTFGVEGDCCSRSWIEHLEMPNDIKGATITGAHDSDYVNATEDDEKNPVVNPGDYQPREYECLKVYQTVFHTDRGDISLEYRNSSNGYYGGSLTDEGEV